MRQIIKTPGLANKCTDDLKRWAVEEQVAHMEIKLRRVYEENAALVEKLLDEYLPELARHRERATGAVDAASYNYLPLYWAESGRYAFTIVLEEQLAGFVFVRQVGKGGAPVSQISEFYVRPSFRRRGVGGRRRPGGMAAIPGYLGVAGPR